MRSSAPGAKFSTSTSQCLDQPIEDFLALGMLGVDGDRALRAVEHGEIEAVGALHVAQLAARDVADARPFDLDHVGAHIGEKLRAGRPRLHVGEVENLDAVERPARLAPRLGDSAAASRSPLRPCGFRRRLLRLELSRLLGGFLRRGFFRRGFAALISLWLSCALPSFLSLFRSCPLLRATIFRSNKAAAARRYFFLRQLALRVEVADAAALAAGRRDRSPR